MISVCSVGTSNEPKLAVARGDCFDGGSYFPGIGNFSGDNLKRYDLSSGTLNGTVGVGKLDGPLGMAIGPDGTVYASSEATGSIEKFDTSGNWLSRFTTANSPKR